MVKNINLNSLFPREKQILEIVYQMGEATAKNVQDKLSDGLSNAAVRTMLNNLEQKNLLHHRVHKGTYIYSPIVPKSRVRKSYMKHILDTFFNGEEDNAVVALLKESEIDLSEEDIEHIKQLIKNAKKNNR
jgi:BlaI family penicillinase repressor